MPEVGVKLKGWQAVVGLVVLAVAFVLIIGVRVVTFKDKKNDAALMRQINTLITSDYLPDEASRLKAAYDSGDANQLSRVAGSVTSTQAKIGSIQASYPLLDFSKTKEVVIKVKYSLTDASGKRKERTKYYLFEHSSIGNIWSYQYETNAAGYFLNFQ